MLPIILLAGAAAPPQEQWIVVLPRVLARAAAPLVEHRRAQGMKVVELRPSDDLRKRIADACKAHHGASSVLLLGSLDLVPPCKGTLSRMKGQPTDAPYGCLDGKRLPAVAVGRLPARDAEEAEAMVAKTLALEKAAPGAWNRSLGVLAGIPAFNPVVDRLVESIAFARVDRASPAWTGRALYTAPSSRFCVPAKKLKERSLEVLQGGQLLTLYLGHSNETGLYAGDAAFLDRRDFAGARMPNRGVFITLGCLGCRLEKEEGYGLSAIRNPQGPAAVFGSHGICFAAMCQLAADGLFEKALAGPLPSRLGTCHLAALEGVAKGRMDFITFGMLDAVDGDPKIPQATQREEHLEMFLLLGDPALRLPFVPALTLEEPGKAVPGKVLTVRGRVPAHLVGGTLEFVLERTPASIPARLRADKGDEAMEANYAEANRFRLLRVAAKAKGPAFAVRLPLPDKLPWPRIVLRVRAMKDGEEALAARRVEVGK
ncbi:MAG: hypothetical protein K2W96_07420 [Gemmataceae bacterium]|nr:hypothetical protein [Gemmataceae bacterium]